MPVSKRNKVVNISKTKKVIIQDKNSQTFEKIKDALATYDYCYLFHYENMYTQPLQALREYFDDSLFLMGKNKVFGAFFGKDEDTAYLSESYMLSDDFQGNAGLFFSNREPENEIEYFDNYSCPYFKSPGQLANESVTLRKGGDDFAGFSSSFENQLRRLGLKVKVDNQKIVLISDFELSKAGEPITSNQARIFRLLGVQDAAFRIWIVSYINKEGKYEKVNKTMDA